MKKLLALTLIIGILCIITFIFLNRDKGTVNKSINADRVERAEEAESNTELMELVVYLQDKDEALYNDCGITYPKTVQVPKTDAVADASLRYLFADELSHYGAYESVVIKNGVAQIVIANESDPYGYKIAALSSCEARHLASVLENTLTQYETIESVELFSPTGKIEF